MKNLIIKNAYLIDPSENLDLVSDILISDGKIKKISKKIEITNEEIIDANNKILLPGLIDFHVHYRDPGETYKEDIESGSNASAKGGFTTVVMMANTDPAIDSVDKVIEQRKTIENFSKIRALQTSALTLSRKGKDLVDIDKLSLSGIVAFSDDGDVVDHKDLMVEGLKKSNEKKFFVLQHAEAKELIDDGSANSGPPAIRMGLAARSRHAEISIIKRDIQIAKENNLKLYFQHLSTKESVDLIRIAKKVGFVIISDNEKNIQTKIEQIRSQVAFYASTKSYRKVMEIHGWENIADQLYRYSVDGKWDKMPSLITDDVLDEFLLVSSLKEAPKKIKSKFNYANYLSIPIDVIYEFGIDQTKNLVNKMKSG